jgi:hypothetical protein
MRSREILDPSMTPDWSSRATSALRGYMSGQWQGRFVTLRRVAERSSQRIEMKMYNASPGSFAIERGDLGVLRRALRLGGPPRIEPMRSEDQRELRVFADDRNQVERLLADSVVQELLRANLVDSGDELSLRRGELRVKRRVHEGHPGGPVVQTAWKLLKEAARVVG